MFCEPVDRSEIEKLHSALNKSAGPYNLCPKLVKYRYSGYNESNNIHLQSIFKL